MGRAPGRRRRAAAAAADRAARGLDATLDLAGDSRTTPEARALVFASLTRLASALKGRRGADPAADAHLRLAERDLAAFLADPAARKPAVGTPPPPGRPIGGR